MGVVGAGARIPIHDEAKARESIRATGGAEPRVKLGLDAAVLRRC
jgi:hypothetical protein